MSRDSLVRLDSLGTEVRIKVHVDLARSPEHGAERPQEHTPLAAEAARERPFPDGEAGFDAPPITRVFGAPGPVLRAGQVLGGRYELERILGCGSMGAVWLARHRTLGERVALKVMAPTSDTDGVEAPSTAVARFRFEAQVAARLSRKTRHVVRVTDHGQDGRIAFLVMEYLEGQTLEELLARRAPMAPGEVARLVAQIARGLEVAHGEGVLHRDLKPANVFLVETAGGPPLVKLLDFGLARGDDSQRLGAPFATGRGVVFGTPGYMSPEQASASLDVDPRADLWSLAVIAYEALTGTLPVDGLAVDEMLDRVRAGKMVPVHSRRPELPPAYEGFFARAFARRADDRFATSAELAEAFERAGDPPVAPVAGAISMPDAEEATTRMPRRGGKAAWAVGAALTLGVVVLGMAYALDRAPLALGDTHATDGTAATHGPTSALPRPAEPGAEAASLAAGSPASSGPAPASSGSIEAAAPSWPANAAQSIASTDSPAGRAQGAPRAAAAPPSDDLGEFKSHF